MSIELFDTRISRRGKGAKGSVEVQTIGKPVVLEGSFVAKSFDYDHVDGLDTSELMEIAKNLGSTNLCLALGIDAMLRKSALQSGSEKTMLRIQLIKAGLATKENAATVAAAYVTIRSQTDMDFDTFCNLRRSKLAKGMKQEEPKELPESESDNDSEEIEEEL